MTPTVRRVATLGLAGLVAVGALKLATLGLARLDCLWLAPLIALLAWPLWAYRSEQAMFVRRLLLAGATTESARLRRWLWRGTAVQSLGVVTALLWAGLMLLAAAQLTALQWVILAADALLLAALSPAMRHLLRREVAQQFVYTVARRWPVLLGNTLLLTLVFVAHDYHVGFADTRTLSWSELVSWTLQSRQADAACSTAAALLGVSALADQLPRHVAMLYLPGVADLHVKLLAWLVMLGVTGFGAYLFTRCLLGVQALLDRGAPRAASDAASPRPGRIFVWTSLATLAVSGKKMYSPRIPQDTANVTSVNGSRAAVGTGRPWALASVVMPWNPSAVARRGCVPQPGSGPSSSTATGDEWRVTGDGRWAMGDGRR